MHEKTHAPKGEALKQRWIDFQNKQKAAHEAKNKPAAQAAPAKQEEEQTRTGATVEEVKTEEVKTEEVKKAPVPT